MGVLVLQQQQITIPINTGIDTKRDEKLTDSEFFLKQENSRLRKAGALTKRNGFDPLNSGLSTPVASGYIPALIASDGSQMINLPGAKDNRAYKYDAVNGQWSQILNQASSYCSVPAALECEPIASSGGSHETQDSDYYNGIIAVVYGENRVTTSPQYQGSIVLKDSTTGTTITKVCNYSGTNYKIRIIDVAGTLYIVVASIDGTSAQIEVWNKTLTTLIASNTTVLLDVPPSMEFNSLRSEVFVLFQRTSTSFKLFKVSTTITDVGNFTVGSTIYQGTFDFKVDATNIYLAYSRLVGVNDHRLRTVTVNKTTLVVGTETEYLPGPTGAIDRIGAAIDGTNFHVAFNIFTPSTQLYELIYVTATLAAMVITYKASVYNYGLQSRVYFNSTSLGISVIFIAQDFKSSRFSYVIMGFNANAIADKFQILGSFLNGKSAQPSSSYPCVVNLHDVETDLLGVVCREGIRASTNIVQGIGSFTQVTLQTQTDFCKIDLSNNLKQDKHVLKLGEALSITGAHLAHYDGQYLFTQFVTRPTIRSATGSGVGGTIAAGTYRFYAIFEYVDFRGQIYRSAPSALSNSVTTAGATSSIACIIDYPYPYGMPLGSKVVLYGNENNGTVFYRINEFTANSPGPVTISRTLPDSSINTGEAIYINGSVLENNTPPPSIHGCIHNNRMWLVSADDDSIYYSKTLLKSEPPNFSDFLYFRANSGQGKRVDKTVGVSSLGDKLAILKKNSVGYVAGDGANETGQQSTLTIPEMLTFDIGCTEPKSIISTPLGVFFKSEKGIYLFEHGLNFKYIGSPVEAYNSEEILAADMIEEDNLVIFVTENRVLVYDYIFNQWSVDTIGNNIDLCVWNKKTTLLKTDYTVGIESTDYNDDFGNIQNDIIMKVITGWIKLTGIQDFARIWRALILGKYYSAHTLTVKAYYNYDDSYSETFTFTPSGSGIYQFECHLRQQKCEAIKFEIYDTGSGQSMDLTGLTLAVGIKKGLYKTRAGVRA